MRWPIAMLALVALVLQLSAAADARPAVRHPSQPDGTVVFFSQRDPAGSLYTESAAGGRLRLLLQGTNVEGDIAGALFDVDPIAWAPDGKHFLYMVLAPHGETQDQLWISDVHGQKTRLLARGSGWPPTWSPDGRRIAFPTGGGIWVANPDGSHAHPVVAGDKPSWSPNGHWIAFLRTGSGCGFDLLAVAPSGGSPRVLGRCVGDAPPSWSADGKRIAYEGRPNGLYVATVRGRRTRLIDSQANGPPAWSPDGNWIAVARGAAGTSGQATGTWIEHPNGSGLRRLTSIVDNGGGLERAATWAPDSRRLALSSGDADIWVLGLNGAARRLTDGAQYGYNNWAPSWQPRNLPPERLGGTVVSAPIPTDTVVVDGVLQATRAIDSISADGVRAVIQYARRQPADLYRSIETWDAGTGAIIRFSGGGGDYQRPALAGNLLAYPVFLSGEYWVWAATTERPAPEVVAGTCPTTFCDDPIGDAVGKGSLLVFDTWKRPQPRCDQPCSGPKQESRLFRLDAGSAVQIASSSGDLTPLAVDSGRVLVREGSDTLVILDAAGAELSRLTVPDFTEASLQGSDVVVHSGEDLDDYDAATGALLHVWPVPAGGHLEDAQVGVAAYVTGSAVHLLRLSDGHDSVVTPPGTGPIHAQLEPQGLFYSYSVADSERPGRLAFVPSAALPSTK